MIGLTETNLVDSIEIKELSTVTVDDAVVMTIDPIAELKKQLDEAKAVKVSSLMYNYRF